MKEKYFEKRLEKVFDELKELKKANKEMRREFDRTDESFKAFKRVILQLQREKEKLELEKKAVSERYREFIDVVGSGEKDVKQFGKVTKESMPMKKISEKSYREIKPEKIIEKGIYKAVSNFDLIRECAKKEAKEILEDYKNGKINGGAAPEKKEKPVIPKRKTKKEFLEVIKNKQMEINEAARKLDVHELQIQAWIDSLKKNGLVRFYADNKVGLTYKGKKSLNKKIFK